MPGPSSDDLDEFNRRAVTRMSDRGRVVRVLAALALSVPGLVPVPYIGWAWGIVLLAPATVLVAFAALDRHARRGVLLCALPTFLGLVLSLYSLVVVIARSDFDSVAGALGISLVTTFIAAVAGSPPVRG